MAGKVAVAERTNGHKEVAPPNSTLITVKAPNFRTMVVQINGDTPLMLSRFSKKAELIASMAEGSRKAKGKKDLPPRDFDRDCEQAKYKDTKKGWDGFNASAIRAGMISACRTVGVKMTQAKLCVFVIPDGADVDGIPLVRIVGKAVKDVRWVRNDNGSVDLRSRPRYDEWSATLRLRFDADMISAQDVANLISRVGLQVGIGEGRPDSKSSAGMEYGLFTASGIPL